MIQLELKEKNYPYVNHYLENIENQTLDSRPLKIGLAITHTWKHAAEYTKEGLKYFINQCSDLGHFVEELIMPSNFEEAHDIHQTIYDKSVSYYFQNEYKKTNLPDYKSFIKYDRKRHAY